MIEQIQPIFGEEEAQATYELIKSGSWLMQFEKTKEFEQEICEFTGAKHCIAVPNGTIGLIIALMAAGVGRGDKVACPAMTMIAPAYAITFLGAEPVFVDIDTTGCMDILKIGRVDAVLFVSANGRAGNIKDAKDFCAYHEIPLIEDACQSLGSDSLGTIGDIGVYSLSPHKIISTGQGGLIVTNCDYIGKSVRRLRDFGRDKGGEDNHHFFGINAKFTDLQAVIGLEQLHHLKDRIDVKKHIYGDYKARLGNKMLEHHGTPWMVDIYVDNRDKLQEFLLGCGIKTRKMYPVIPYQRFYRDYESFPVAAKMADRGLWLPSSLNLSNEELETICLKVNEYLGNAI